ncbi:hypothetical protein HPP92_008892 [Vanilla planifolia]|uniref:Uncharacterized protein n=1 Tax=Vanilla planifolia TaxID=51239 RepID=A0A835RIN3_VANPL|nr:hypothetical protein HPP92_008892 [Vanilla planifolia]
MENNVITVLQAKQFKEEEAGAMHMILRPPEAMGFQVPMQAEFHKVVLVVVRMQLVLVGTSIGMVVKQRVVDTKEEAGENYIGMVMVVKWMVVAEKSKRMVAEVKGMVAVGKRKCMVVEVKVMAVAEMCKCMVGKVVEVKEMVVVERCKRMVVMEKCKRMVVEVKEMVVVEKCRYMVVEVKEMVAVERCKCMVVEV